MTQAQVVKFLINLRSAFSGLEKLPFPTIAAIDGPALGDSLEMEFCHDLWVVGSSPIPIICTFRCAYLTNLGSAVAKISLTEMKPGIVPGASGTRHLTRLADLSKAKNLIFTA